MSWRPENWDGIETKVWSAVTQVGEQFPVGFEAGADAMLEAICQEIEKVENPIQNIEGIPQADFINYDRGFDKAKYLILALLRKEVNNGS